VYRLGAFPHLEKGQVENQVGLVRERLLVCEIEEMSISLIFKEKLRSGLQYNTSGRTGPSDGKFGVTGLDRDRGLKTAITSIPEPAPQRRWDDRQNTFPRATR